MHNYQPDLALVDYFFRTKIRVPLTCLAGLNIAATQNQVARIFEIRQQSRWHPAFDMTAASTELTSVGGGFAETVPLH